MKEPYLVYHTHIIATTGSTEAHLFAQELSSFQRFQVRQHRILGFQFASTEICESNLIPVRKGEPLCPP